MDENGESTQWFQIDLGDMDKSGSEEKTPDASEAPKQTPALPEPEGDPSANLSVGYPYFPLLRARSPLGLYVINTSDFESEEEKEVRKANGPSAESKETNQGKSGGNGANGSQNASVSNAWFDIAHSGTDKYDPERCLPADIAKSGPATSFDGQSELLSYEDSDTDKDSAMSDVSVGTDGRAEVYEDAEESFYGEASNESTSTVENKASYVSLTRRFISHAEKTLYLLYGPDGFYTPFTCSSGQKLIPPTFPYKDASWLLDMITEYYTDTLRLSPWNKYSRIIKISSLRNDPFVPTTILQSAIELWLKESVIIKYYQQPDTYVGFRNKRRERERLWFQKAVLNKAIQTWARQSQNDDTRNPYSYYYAGNHYVWNEGGDDCNGDDYSNQEQAHSRREGRPKLERKSSGGDIQQKGKNHDEDKDGDIILEDDWEDRAFRLHTDESEQAEFSIGDEMETEQDNNQQEEGQQQREVQQQGDQHHQEEQQQSEQSQQPQQGPPQQYIDPQLLLA